MGHLSSSFISINYLNHLYFSDYKLQKIITLPVVVFRCILAYTCIVGIHSVVQFNGQ